MSTIYVFHTECSSMDTMASGDRILTWDTSTGRTVYSLASDIATYVGSNPGTLASPVINTATLNGTFSVSSSVVFGSTQSARISFFGVAGTSAATTIAALTTTLLAGQTGNFSVSAACFSIISAINGITQILKDCGLVKT